MTDIKISKLQNQQFINKKITISDFIPYYSTYDNIDYYPSIMGKKEIYTELKETEPKQNKLFQHQKMMSRFMSSHTLNDSILLYHEMGAGKTIATVAICEQIRRESSTIKQAYVFAKSKLLLKNFFREIQEFTKEPKSSLEKFYKIKKKHPVKNKKTYNTFATALSKRVKQVGQKKTDILHKYTNKQLIEDFSNSIIIMDEIHNIRDINQDAKDILSKDDINQLYDIFYHFLHIIKNCKIILLSGTPMRDSAIEIIDIVNLILPQEKKLKKDYFFIKKDTYSFDSNKTLEFKKKVKGYVSVLENEKSEIKKKFTMGVSEKEYKEILDYHLPKETKFSSNYIKFHILPIEKDSLQEKMYIQNKKDYENYQKNKKDQKDQKDTKRLKDRFREISKLVYPNPNPKPKQPEFLFGKEGFDNYIETIKKEIIKNDEPVIKKEYKLKDNFINTILKKDIKTDTMNKEQQQIKMIENIKEISNKFSYVISEAIRCYKEKKCMFVYCREIQNAGIIFLLLILQELGYKQALTTKECDNQSKRMMILTSNQDISKPSHFQSLNTLFNEEKNKDGSYIQLIIASDTIVEGFSFFHIQREIIITPWYNFSKIDQIIARGIRAKSHRYLQNKTVEISLLVSVCTHLKTYDSIDLEQYTRSILKDKEIKKIYRLLKESSFDCHIAYNRNKSMSQYKDNTRECDYEKCDYECDVKKECLKLKKDCDGKDRTTYNLYYIHEQNNQSYQTERMIIQLFFKKNNIEKTDVNTLFRFIDNYFKSSHRILKKNILDILKLDEKEKDYMSKPIRLDQIVNYHNPVIQEIKSLFQKQNIISYKEIKDYFKLKDMDDFQLLYFLNYIIENNIIIRNKYYLREDKDIYYIVDRVEMIQHDNRLFYYVDEKNNEMINQSFTEYQFRTTYNFDYLIEEFKKMSDHLFYFTYYKDEKEKKIYEQSFIEYNKLKNIVLGLHFNDNIIIETVKQHISEKGYSFLNEHKNFNLLKVKKPIYLIQFYFKNYLQQISDHKIMFNYHFQSFVFDIVTKKWTKSLKADQLLWIKQKNKIMDKKIKIICRYDSTNFVSITPKVKKRYFWIIFKNDDTVRHKLNQDDIDARTKNTGKVVYSYSVEDLKEIIKTILLHDYKILIKNSKINTKITQQIIDELKKKSQNDFYRFSSIVDTMKNILFQNSRVSKKDYIKFIEEWCFSNNFLLFKSGKESKEFKKQKLLLFEPEKRIDKDIITFIYDLFYIDEFKLEKNTECIIKIKYDIKSNNIYLQSIEHQFKLGFEKYIIEMLKEIQKSYMNSDNIFVFTDEKNEFQSLNFKQIKK